MAAMAMKESGGGDTCANNSCCVGILQLNFGSSGVLDVPGIGQVTKAQYANMSLQQQVDIWALTANSNTGSSGYQTLLADYNSGQSIGGVPVTAGMLAACEQFGAAVCNHNVSALASGGTCGGYTDGTGHTGGQTICSWGQAADQQAANQQCSPSVASCPMGPGDCGTGPKSIAGNATQPSASSADLTLPASAG